MATIQANPNPRHHQRQDVLEDPLDTKVRRRLIGTWTFLLVLATGGVLAWFFAIR